MALPDEQDDAHSEGLTTRRELIKRLVVGGAALALPGPLADTAFAQRSKTFGSSLRQESFASSLAKLTIGIQGSFDNLDSTSHSGSYHYWISTLVAERLVDYDAIGRPQLALASNVKRPNARTLVYTVRPGIKWPDGTPLTADDVVWSLRRSFNPSVDPSAGLFDGWQSVQKTGPAEVTIRLKSPVPFYDVLVGSWQASIFQKALFVKNGSKVGTPAVPITGTGPYQVTQFEPGTSVTLTARKNYWGKKPYVRQLVFPTIIDPADQLVALQSGAIDAMFDLPVQQLHQLTGIPGTRTYVAPSLRTPFFFFNFAKEPFGDIHVRRAFAHCIDKQSLIKALQPGATVARGLCPVDQWGELLPPAQVRAAYAKLPEIPFSLSLAKQELAQSSVPNGFSVDLQYFDPTLSLLAQAVGQNLSKIGITINLKQVTQQQFYAAITAADKPALSLKDWGPDDPDPADNIYATLHSKFATANGFNIGNFRDARVDQLLDAQLVESNKARRAKDLLDAMRIVLQQVGVAPTWEGVKVAVVSKKVRLTGYGPWMPGDQVWSEGIVAP